jgi:choline dehydrogenase-like flavoprotein
MIHDFRNYGDGARIDADVCIIGAGPAGLALAHEFLGSAKKVVLLESGGLRRDPDVDALNEAESVGLSHRGSVDGRARLFGGTTRLWEGQCVPLAELDFVRRDWVAHSGWPISKADLNPYYRRAETFFGIGGERYDATVAERFDIVSPPLDRTALTYDFAVLVPRPELRKVYRSPFKDARNVLTLLHATATRIKLREDGGGVDHVDVRSPEGACGEVRATAVVLTAGGIENARLLLTSNDVHATGIGNRHDLVGRFLQEHPTARPARIETGTSAGLVRLYSLLHGKRGLRYLPKIGLAPERQRAARMLNCSARVAFEFGADSGAGAAQRLYSAVRRGHWPEQPAGGLWRVASDPLEVVHLARRYAARRYARGRASDSGLATLWLETSAEQVPNPESRVTLSRRCDRFGSNLPRIEWRLTDLDRRTAETFTEAVAAEFERLGLARLRPAKWLHDEDGGWRSEFSDSYHHMGTTRLAEDAKRGVVDEHCAVHGCRGLHIAGSSVFPTSGCANPTLTIVALSLRLADRLKATALA